MRPYQRRKLPKCPKCGSEETEVSNVEEEYDVLKCPVCHHEWKYGEASRPTARPPTISKPVKELRSLLSSYLFSALFAIGGFGIVLWQIFSPVRIILFISIIPIPLILVGIVLFAFGFATNIYTLVSMLRHSSVSVRLVTIPLAFSLVIFSSFGIVMINTMHETVYSGTSVIDTRKICDQVFGLINEERKIRDLPILSFDANLQSVSQIWSEELAERRVLEHGDFAARMEAIEYGNFQCGEIIAKISLVGIGFLQSPVEREFIDGWLASPGHRSIMLTPSSGFLGVGCAKNSDTVYCVADFRFD